MKPKGYIIIEIDNVKYAIKYSSTIQELVRRHVTLENEISLYDTSRYLSTAYATNRNLAILDTLREKRNIEEQILKYMEENE